MTSMGIAARSANTDLVSFLRHRGAYLDEQGEDGRRPLTHAISGLEEALLRQAWPKKYEANIAAIMKLLDLGASPAYDLAKERYLSHEWTYQVTPIAHFFDLLASGWLSADQGLPIIRKLLLRGAGANSVGADGRAPIHIVFTLEQTVCLPLLRLILRHGANPNLQDLEGRIPLEWAFQTARDTPEYRNQKSDTQVIELLLNHGADPNKQCSDGRVPLNLAVRNIVESGSEGTVVLRRLLQCGAEPRLAGSMVREAVISYLDTAWYHRAKNDYNTLAAQFYRTPLGTGWEVLDENYQVSMRIVAVEAWQIPMLPVLLRAGATVSRSYLDTAAARLLSLGGLLEEIYDVEAGLDELYSHQPISPFRAG
ncbi:ankyrin repeat-containing domain protein [Coniochaeta sp. 2T2.1]|nr:ankyrin repeat-containing domain protein [Coniochaeta sp. 2T2.1]